MQAFLIQEILHEQVTVKYVFAKEFTVDGIRYSPTTRYRLSSDSKVVREVRIQVEACFRQGADKAELVHSLNGTINNYVMQLLP